MLTRITKISEKNKKKSVTSLLLSSLLLFGSASLVSSCSTGIGTSVGLGTGSGAANDISGAGLSAGLSTGLNTGSSQAMAHTAAPLQPADGSLSAAEPGVVTLFTDKKQAFSPINCVETKPGQLIFLGGDCLYVAQTKLPSATAGGSIRARRIPAPGIEGTGRLAIPVHELVNLIYSPLRESIIVLDKSGDLFEYNLVKKNWSVLRANVPISGSPDPEFIDFCMSDQSRTLNLLDPERNQIWRLALTPGSAKVNPILQATFAEVMPWRLKPGDTSVAECIAIVFDQQFSLLKQFGQLTTIIPLGGQNRVAQRPLSMNPIGFKLCKVRPSRMITSAGSDVPLLVVERQNNRILAVDKKSGDTRPYLFAANSSLRGLLAQPGGFWAIDGDCLRYRRLSESSPGTAILEHRQNDARLAKLRAPMRGMRLPKHAGVYPGARRLYRYGVHEGLDLFNDRFRVSMDTPVVAAGPGKIVRADSNFVDMNRSTFNRVMTQCVNEHRTSDQNEDLFRGCQVWVDHGEGMITRYAHLNKINAKLRLGQSVKAGDLLGFVGVSGTGQNLPGRTKYPHLHFEILLDGKYLGYGLTPAETVGIFEDIFESAH